MHFTGWPPEALDWFRGIEADNSRTWFLAHKAMYENAVRQPLEWLLADVADEFGEGRVFRQNRDTRFSPDKTPYKTWAAATIGGHGEGGGYYVSVSANGLTAGAGYWMMSRDQLERFRAAVDADRTGPTIDTIVRDLRRRKLEVGGHDRLTTSPRGYPKDHPRIELLREKGMAASRTYAVRAWLHTKTAKERIVDVWRTAGPMIDWLDANVGPAEVVPDR